MTTEHKTVAERLWASLGFCGCGDPEGWGRFLLSVLEECESEEWPSYEDTARMLALAILDNGELTEHGTTVRCSWPTERGRQWLEWFQDEIAEAEASE